MGDKVSDSPVRIIGSRELHQNLPAILRELENDNVRYVLTVHGKPRAVLVGAEPYLNMVLNDRGPSDGMASAASITRFDRLSFFVFFVFLVFLVVKLPCPTV